MAEGRTSDAAEESGQASSDRLWILVNTSLRESAPERVSGRPPRETMVIRDGDTLLVSVDVGRGRGRGSALTVPFNMVELGRLEATLVVRLAATSAPCAACVDESLARAAQEPGGLDTERVFRAVRAAIAGCAHRAHGEGPRAAADAGGPPPESSGPRPLGALRLAPVNAPHVPAGGAPGTGGALGKESELELLLIL